MNNRLISACLAGFITLVTTQASALVPAQLAGNWSHDGQTTTIQLARGYIQVCNEQGNCAPGFLRKHHRLEVPQWNVFGVVQRHGTIIDWNNGTRWVKEMPRRKGVQITIGNQGYPAQQGYQAAPSTRYLSGPWMHAGKPTSLHVAGDGRNFTITNEEGVTSSGYIEPNGTLVLPTVRITGTVQGNQIVWSNNTVWYRR